MILLKRNFWLIANILALLTYLCVANNIRLKDPKPLIKDSEEYVILSHNLAFKGIFSSNGYSLTNFREPVSSFLNAINIRLFTNIDKDTSFNDMISNPEIITQLTQINIFYLLLFFLAMWWLTYLMTGTHGWVILTTFLPMSFFTIGTIYTQRLLSDLPSIILLMVSVSLVVKINRKPIIRTSVLLAVVLAILILSKGVFFYVVPIYVLFIFFIFWLKKEDKNKVSKIKFLLFSFVGSIFLLLPWMIRNKIHLNDFSLTQRGGTILMIRAEKNQMSKEEFKGSFYVYSPDVLKKLFFERFLGYKEEDYWDGGKLQRLNRDLKGDYHAIDNKEYEKLVSFLRRSMYVSIPKIQSEAIEKGLDPEKYLKEQALELILKDPIRHIKISFAFAWRGIWYYNGNHLFYVALIGFSYMSFFYLAVISFIKRDTNMLIFIGVPVLFFLFHSLLTHNISRYLLPILSFVSISPIILFSIFLDKYNFKFTKSIVKLFN